MGGSNRLPQWQRFPPMRRTIPRWPAGAKALRAAISPSRTCRWASSRSASGGGGPASQSATMCSTFPASPIGYHGRASSVRASGEPVVRPNGQRKAPDADALEYGPSRRLDYELELGIWIGRGNELGEPIPIGEADRHVAGFCLLNDWSARDIQAWE